MSLCESGEVAIILNVRLTTPNATRRLFALSLKVEPNADRGLLRIYRSEIVNSNYGPRFSGWQATPERTKFTV